MELDNNGNIYVAGLQNDAPSPAPGGYIVKLDDTASILWSEEISGTATITSINLSVDAFDNVFILCTSNMGTLYFDSDPSRKWNMTDVHWNSLLAKLNPNGEIIMSKAWYGIEMTNLAIGSDGYINIVGGYTHETNGILGYTILGEGDAIQSEYPSLGATNGSFDCFLIRLSEDWDIISSLTWGGTGLDRVTDICLADSGDICCAGYMQGPLNVPVGGETVRNPYEGTMTFASIISQSGTMKWINTNIAYDIPSAVYTNIHENKIIVATCSPPSIRMITNDGKTEWEHSWGQLVDSIGGIQILNNNDIFLSMTYNDNISEIIGASVKNVWPIGIFDSIIIDFDYSGEVRYYCIFGEKELGTTISDLEINEIGSIYILGCIISSVNGGTSGEIYLKTLVIE